jgi:DMSO/TMAO reductase YedYZ molybdopterin-dependent catalytic subunit
MIDRRSVLQGGVALLAGTSLLGKSTLAFAEETVTLPFGNGTRPLGKFPQKRTMIVQTSRPPQLETPFSVFNESVITPNDAFFVRYHLAGIPLDIDPDKFTVEVKGKVDKPLKLSLADLKKMPSKTIVAVTQCSGNSRAFSNPRVAGGQSGNGAMGNARWKGVPLKAVLEKAGVQSGAKQVVFGGLDGPAMDTTPDFSFVPLATLVMNERTVKRLIGTVAFGAVPGSTQAHSLSGMRYAVFIQKLSYTLSMTVISLRCLTQ